MIIVVIVLILTRLIKFKKKITSYRRFVYGPLSREFGPDTESRNRDRRVKTGYDRGWAHRGLF